MHPVAEARLQDRLLKVTIWLAPPERRRVGRKGETRLTRKSARLPEEENPCPTHFRKTKVQKSAKG